jgi:hypothetical protein
VIIARGQSTLLVCERLTPSVITTAAFLEQNLDLIAQYQSFFLLAHIHSPHPPRTFDKDCRQNPRHIVLNLFTAARSRHAIVASASRQATVACAGGLYQSHSRPASRCPLGDSSRAPIVSPSVGQSGSERLAGAAARHPTPVGFPDENAKFCKVRSPPSFSCNREEPWAHIGHT